MYLYPLNSRYFQSHKTINEAFQAFVELSGILYHELIAISDASIHTDISQKKYNALVRFPLRFALNSLFVSYLVKKLFSWSLDGQVLF